MGNGGMPRWIQVSSRTGHLILSGVGIVAVTVVYITKGQVPADVLIGILSSNGIGAFSSIGVTAADRMTMIPSRPSNDQVANSGV